jgi:hypothetical protein
VVSMDNASSNDTAMDAIAEEFELDAVERRLRCAGHIINLIARSLLYGFDKNLFAEDIAAEDEGTPTNLEEDLKR